MFFTRSDGATFTASQLRGLRGIDEFDVLRALAVAGFEASRASVVGEALLARLQGVQALEAAAPS